MSQSIRRQAREMALQILFQREFLGRLDLDATLSLFKGSYAAPEEVWSYARSLCQGVLDQQAQIDQLIQSRSAHWALNRMALVDLIIMRVATFEIKYSQEPVPPAAAMNEAIEISRKYGTSDSAAFVNGILDQIARQAP